MLLIGDPANKELSERLAESIEYPIVYPELTVFPDSEQRVRITKEISGEKVYILKSVTAPVDTNVINLVFLTDAARRAGADKIIGLIPYIPYMRADHVFRSGEAVPLEIVIKMLETAGLNEIMTVDPHSVKIPEMFEIPFGELTALSIFADKIRQIERDKSNITIVTPDMGGIRRLKMLDQMLGGVNQVVINKDRDYESGELKVAAVKGEVANICFIVDDIISTGNTITQAVDVLFENGAKDVNVFATHPVFSGDAPNVLKNSRASKIFVTDSIPLEKEKQFENLEILSLADTIAEAIKSS